MISLWIALLAPISASAAESATPCAASAYSEPTYTAEHNLKDGTKLHLCGEKSGGEGGVIADLTVEAKGQKPLLSDVQLGGIEDSAPPFGLNPVKIKLTDYGLEVTDLIPVTEKEFVPAFIRKMNCSAKGCAEQPKISCAFKKIKAKVDRSVLKALKNRKTAPNNSDVMIAYRNALAGDKASRKALLDPGLIKQETPDEGEPVAGLNLHQSVVNNLEMLRRHHCL